MPPAKSLPQLVRSRSFRARRHADLLHGPLVSWPELAKLQTHFQDAARGLEARQAAVEFERAVRNHVDRGELPWPQQFYATCGPGAAELEWFRDEEGTVDVAAYQELEGAWEEWNERFGLRWRARHNCLGHQDTQDIFLIVTGFDRVDLRTIEADLPAVLAKFARTAGRGKISDPPGWHHFRTAAARRRGGVLPPPGPRTGSRRR